MLVIVCSFVCCLLIYVIITIKVTTKQMMNRDNTKSNTSIKLSKLKTDSVQHTTTTSNKPSDLHDWQLSMNNSHRLSTPNPQSPLDSDTNQTSSPFPLSSSPEMIPNPTQIYPNQTMIEKSASNHVQYFAYDYRYRFEENSESKHCSEEEYDKKEARVNHESEGLDIVIGHDPESTITPTMELRELNMYHSNMTSLAQISTKAQQNTMSVIDGVNELTNTLEYNHQSKTTFL